VATERQTLIRNEQSKLTATYLNGLAIALAAVGGLSPIVGFAQGTMSSTVLSIVCPTCWVASMGVHLWARSVLRKLVL
jgi:multisubunit Na+/H+ antiporter MnhB subunit